MAYYANDIQERLTTRQPHQGWEVRSFIHHIDINIVKSDSLPSMSMIRKLRGHSIASCRSTKRSLSNRTLISHASLALRFSAGSLRQAPTGQDGQPSCSSVRMCQRNQARARPANLARLAGSYASWFTTQPMPTPPSTQGAQEPSLLMSAISYVVAALPEPHVCLQAADALRDMCDANRDALAPHIGAFGELHAGLTGIPVRSFVSLCGGRLMVWFACGCGYG